MVRSLMSLLINTSLISRFINAEKLQLLLFLEIIFSRVFITRAESRFYLFIFCQLDSKTHFACLGICFYRNLMCAFINIIVIITIIIILFNCSSEQMWSQKLQVGQSFEVYSNNTI